MNRFFLVLSFVFINFLVAGCSESSGTKPPRSQSPDHIFAEVDANESKNWIRPTDCRKNISEIICEVEAQEENQSPLDRKCLGGEQKYQKTIEGIYDGLDPINQRMFCSLRRIFVERDFQATAYATTLYKIDQNGTPETLPGAMVGVRKSVLELNPDLNSWLTWKEQLNFTSSASEFEPILPYPIVRASEPVPLLNYVFAHEFGHIFDFTNEVNKVILGDPTCGGKTPASAEEYMQLCKPEIGPDSWGAISWETVISVKKDKDFPYRKQLCFYWCTEHMETGHSISQLYKGLANSDFVSSYASTNINDDFAEAWAVRWLIVHKNGDFTTDVSFDYSFKTSDIFYSEKFKEKRLYLEKLISEDLVYP